MLKIGGVDHRIEGLDVLWTPLHQTLQRKRRGNATAICLHTRMGIAPQTISAEKKSNMWHREFPKRMWEAKQKGRVASAHLTVGPGGQVGCHADLIKSVTYNCTTGNEYVVGVECWQDSDGTIYQATIDSVVELCGALCAALKIQRQVIVSDKIDLRCASPNHLKKHEYLEGGQNFRFFSGICGHSNITRNRGPGDCGPHFKQALLAVGFEGI